MRKDNIVRLKILKHCCWINITYEDDMEKVLYCYPQMQVFESAISSDRITSMHFYTLPT